MRVIRRKKRRTEKKDLSLKKTDLYANSNIGLRRHLNEDVAFFISGSNFSLLFVADGMGGNPKGEVASAIAGEAFSTVFNPLKEEGIPDEGTGKKLLKKAIRRANTVIHRYSASKDEYYGMGTTAVVSLILNDKTLIMSCGDSRAYTFFKNGEFRQETVDQTVVEYLYRLDAISKEERNRSSRRHMLMNAVGIAPSVQFELKEIPNDYEILLLCSDGLTNMVEDEEIKRIIGDLKSEGAKSIGSALITSALLGGGLDNVSVAIAEVRKK